MLLNRAAGGRAAVGGMFALAAGIGIGRFVYTPILPVMMSEGTVTVAGAGLLASANYVGYFAGAMAVTFLMPRESTRRLLALALGLNAILLAAMSWPCSYAQLASLRLIGGAAGALIMVLATQLAIDAPQGGQRRGAMSWHFAGVGIGIVVSAVGVEISNIYGGGADSMWLVSGSLAGAMSLIALVLLPVVPNEAFSFPLQTSTRPNNIVRGKLIIAYGLFGFGYVISATFLVTMVSQSTPMADQARFVWVMFGLVAIPSVWLWNWLAERLCASRAYALAAMIASLGASIGAVSNGPFAVFASGILIGGTFMGMTSLGLAAGRNLASGDIGRLFAGMTACFALGQVIGPGLAGLLADALGDFSLAMGVAGIALAASGFLALGLPNGDARSD